MCLIFRQVHHLKEVRFPEGFSDSATGDLLTSKGVDYRHGHHVPSTVGIDYQRDLQCVHYSRTLTALDCRRWRRGFSPHIVVLSQVYLADSLHNLSWSLIFINDDLHVVTAIPRLIVLSCFRFLFKSVD